MPKAKYEARGTIFIPQSIVSPNFTIQITADDGTVYDVTEDLIDLSVTLSGTTEISSCMLNIFNNSGEYTNKFNGGETVEVYFDYSDASNLYFRGKLVKYNYTLSYESGFGLNIEARDYPEIKDKNITISFSNADIYQAFVGTSGSQDAQGNYEDGALYETGLTWHASNPTSSTTTVYRSFEDRSHLEVFSYIAQKCGCDWYILYSGSTWYIRLFEEGSIENAVEYISYGQNLETVQGIGKDFDDEKNRVRVYGKTDDNIIYLKTESNTTSQDNLWIKDKRINETSLDSNTSVEEKGEYEISISTAEQSGNITSFALPTLKPGEKIYISVPYCNMNDKYIIKRIVTTIDSNGCFSSLDIKKSSDTIATFFQQRIEENYGLQPFVNLNNMDESYVIDFENGDTGTHSNTQVNDNRLQLVDTSTSGTWLSDTVTTDSNFNQIELRLKSNYDIDVSRFYVSNNGGDTWTRVDYGVLYTLSDSNNKLKIKVEFVPGTENPYPRIDKICVLYK